MRVLQKTTSSRSSQPRGTRGDRFTLRVCAAWLGVVFCATIALPLDGQAGPSGPRELLHLFGIDQSHFDHVADGVPWRESENELLLKIVFRLPRFRLTEIEGWARDDLEPAELAEDPEAYRGEIFRLFGRVISLTAVEPPPEVVQLFELSRYYRCEFLLDGQQSAVVFARTVPQAWKTDEPIDESAGALGMFLKVGSEDLNRPQPYFVASRIAWHPPTRLGKLGMDVGLFDDLKKRKDRRLTADNRECFYQMLAAAGRAKPGQLLQEANEQLRHSGDESFSVVPLFNQPAEQHGRLVALSGTAREVSRIRVEDEDIQTRFGIDHYYQLFLFTDDSQGNPLVFCVRELPPEMPTGKGPQFGEHVTVAGFFFNTWAYRSRQQTGQLAPLLIGRQPVWQPRQGVSSNPVVGVIAGAVFVLLLLGIWLAMWRYSRGDKRFHDQTLAKQLASDSDVSLDELGLDADGTPDFSGLDQIDNHQPKKD